MRPILMGYALIPVIMIVASLVAPANAQPAFTLTSPSFQNGGKIPTGFTCSGRNVSPALQWRGAPSGTRSLSLILADPDAPMGTFIHWVIYNISSETSGLPEGMNASSSTGNSQQGTNGRDETGYTGPCPPPGKPHHYNFHLYALDERLDLKPGATAHQVETAMKGHILGSTDLVGIFER